MTIREKDNRAVARAVHAATTASLLARRGHMLGGSSARDRVVRQPDPTTAYGCVDWFRYPTTAAPERSTHPR